jgi:hypothetical protein
VRRIDQQDVKRKLKEKHDMTAKYPPRTHPRAYSFKAGDFHLIANAITKTIKAYDYKGALLWEKPALMEGQHYRYWLYAGATPPGVYYLGELYNDLANGTMERAYGWLTFDMVDLEGREDGNDRAGICLHGGGSALPDPFAPYQKLLPTYGCIRMHNQDLRDYVLPLYKKGRVFISVYQD